jgi:putative ABC transport system permease protein
MARALSHTHPPVPAITSRPRVSIAALTAVVAAVGVALSLQHDGSTGDSSSGLFDATRGPDLVVSGLPGVDLAALRALPGLESSSGPFAGVDTSARYRGREVGMRLEGRPPAQSAVDRPRVVSGGWARPRAVVLERATARSLGAPVGSTVTISAAEGKVRLTVSGVVETVARSRRPGNGRGLGYVVPDTLAGVAPKATHGTTMLLRLADPDRAGRYATEIRQRYPGGQVAVEVPSR